jgi:hypothetical protein
MCEPVRRSAGVIVVTEIPSLATSFRKPCEKPVTANFAVL